MPGCRLARFLVTRAVLWFAGDALWKMSFRRRRCLRKQPTVARFDKINQADIVMCQMLHNGAQAPDSLLQNLTEIRYSIAIPKKVIYLNTASSRWFENHRLQSRL